MSCPLLHLKDTTHLSPTTDNTMTAAAAQATIATRTIAIASTRTTAVAVEMTKMVTMDLNEISTTLTTAESATEADRQIVYPTRLRVLHNHLH